MFAAKRQLRYNSRPRAEKQVLFCGILYFLRPGACKIMLAKYSGEFYNRENKELNIIDLENKKTIDQISKECGVDLDEVPDLD